MITAAPFSGPAAAGPGPAAPEPAPDSHRLAGRYQVLGLLGSGGMGSVYRARDVELNEEVALKVLRGDLLHAPELLARFRQEVRLARQVTHHNVARTFDIGEDLKLGVRFLTMELLDGEPLGKLLDRSGEGRGPMPLLEALRIVAAVCTGLAAAHAAGVVHRDLKPDNIFLCSDGRVVITDFGIACSLGGPRHHAKPHEHGLVGTPAYMAPEQIDLGPAGHRAETVAPPEAPILDGRADIYALGCVMYELLTGEQPWTGESAYAVLAARLLRPPPDPRQRRQVPDAVAEVVLRAMAREPAERFAGPEQMLAAIGALGAAAPQGPHEGAPATLRPKERAGHRAVAVLPFRNLGAAEDQYLADGLTEDLIDTLSQASHGLRVRPRGAVLPFRDADPEHSGRSLGVEVIVEGSVRRAGTGLRVQVKVISVADGFQLWARRFDRSAQDLLVVSDEVAHAVAAALTVELVAARTEIDPRALDLYLRARHEYHKVDRLRVLHAVELFEQAAAIEPDDPMILVGLALARARLWFFGGEGARERAHEVAERALRAAPGRGEPYLARAMLHFQGQELAAAVADIRQALRHAPALAEAYDLLGRILGETGPLEDGLAALHTAEGLDPGREQVQIGLARASALMGDWATVDRIVSRVQADTAAMWIFVVRLALWRRDRERIAAMMKVPEIPGQAPIVRALQAFLEGRADSQSVPYPGPEGQLSDRSRAFYHQIRVEAACLSGDRDQAFYCLQLADQAQLMDLVWLDRCPLLEPLRRLPGFRALREQVFERVQGVRRALKE